VDKSQEAVGFYGRVDILVNNAGVGLRGSVLETDIAVDRKVMEVNFFGTIALTKGKPDACVGVEVE
jgi:short-subunit dehydrogenase